MLSFLFACSIRRSNIAPSKELPEAFHEDVSPNVLHVNSTDANKPHHVFEVDQIATIVKHSAKSEHSAGRASVDWGISDDEWEFFY